jgi:hypothetical protein
MRALPVGESSTPCRISLLLCRQTRERHQDTGQTLPDHQPLPAVPTLYTVVPAAPPGSGGKSRQTDPYVDQYGGGRPESPYPPGHQSQWTSTFSCPSQDSPLLMSRHRPGPGRPLSPRRHRHRCLASLRDRCPRPSVRPGAPGTRPPLPAPGGKPGDGTPSARIQCDLKSPFQGFRDTNDMEKLTRERLLASYSISGLAMGVRLILVCFDNIFDNI